jgi:transcription antitermination protein NusB
MTSRRSGSGRAVVEPGVPESRIAARRQAVFLLYQRDVTGLGVDELEENAERDRERVLDVYTRDLVADVTRDLGAIDATIDRTARGWSVDRIAPLERNILRVAVHELASRPDIPTGVAIDEAVDLAKRYCQADAGAFVNGILGAVAADVREGGSA